MCECECELGGSRGWRLCNDLRERYGHNWTKHQKSRPTTRRCKGICSIRIRNNSPLSKKKKKTCAHSFSVYPFWHTYAITRYNPKAAKKTSPPIRARSVKQVPKSVPSSAKNSQTARPSSSHPCCKTPGASSRPPTHTPSCASSRPRPRA